MVVDLSTSVGYNIANVAKFKFGLERKRKMKEGEGDFEEEFRQKAC